MEIAFIADPLSTFKIHKDTTYAMMREAARRGHGMWVMEQGDIARLPSGCIEARACRLHLTYSTAGDWYRLDAPAARALADFDVVVMRKDPPFDMEYIYSTYLLEMAEQQGARVYNKPQAIRDHNEKLSILGFSQFTAPTLVTRDIERLVAFHAEQRDIILKPLDGMGGSGIFRVGEDARNLGAIAETLTDDGRRTIMAQRYIPAIQDGDKRILLIAGQPVPYALARLPQGTEVRGNLAAGGLGRAQPLSPRDLEIAQHLGAPLWARGLLLVGLDVIGDYLTEVNVTSPTCFQEISDQTGFDVAAMFIDALETATPA